MLQEPVVTGPGVAELLVQTGTGSVAAFTALYDRLSAMAFGVGRALLADPVVAERATEEAFLTIWRTAVRWDPDSGDATAWVLRIVCETVARHR